jgi:carboxymethylenebutenolidase
MSCKDCSKGNVLSGYPTGVIDTNTGAYFAAARNPSSRAIVLLTDAFGLPLVNCKIMADRLSQELSCDVWVPDMFDGPYSLSLIIFFHLAYALGMVTKGAPLFTVGSLNTPDVPGVKMTFMETIGLTALLIRRLPYFISNRPSKCDERIDKVYI